jgi:alanyl-tRNA synthetase
MGSGRDGAPEGRSARTGPAPARPATDKIWFALREKLGATEFLGYDTETAEGVMLALVKDGKEVDRLRP